MTFSRIILASASPRRRQLREAIGVPFRCILSEYAEPPVAGASPAQLALLHAIEKARLVSAAFPEECVLAADTVVDLDGTALGKPRDDADARVMLTRLAGRWHKVHTGYAVVSGGHVRAECVSVEVEMHAINADEIAAYVATGEPRDKAGAYGIQAIGACLVAQIRGDYFAVVGLPVSRVMRALKASGFIIEAR